VAVVPATNPSSNQDRRTTSTHLLYSVNRLPEFHPGDGNGTALDRKQGSAGPGLYRCSVQLLVWLMLSSVLRSDEMRRCQ